MYKFTDPDNGDYLSVSDAFDSDDEVRFAATDGATRSSETLYLNRAEVTRLRDALSALLGDTRPPQSAGTVTVSVVPVLADDAIEAIRQEISDAVGSIRLTLTRPTALRSAR